jgi:hypothetical protein
MRARFRHLSVVTQTMFLRFLSGRILMTLRAALALYMVSSPAKGLIPLRALVAGLRTTVSFIRPGTVYMPGPRLPRLFRAPNRMA